MSVYRGEANAAQISRNIRVWHKAHIPQHTFDVRVSGRKRTWRIYEYTPYCQYGGYPEVFSCAAKSRSIAGHSSTP